MNILRLFLITYFLGSIIVCGLVIAMFLLLPNATEAERENLARLRQRAFCYVFFWPWAVFLRPYLQYRRRMKRQDA